MSRDEHLDDLPAGADVRVTLSRRELSRARRQRQGRNRKIGALLFVVLLIAFLRWHSPQAPGLVVAWPNSQKWGSATLENGATVVIRAGQPFVVSLSNPNDWDVSWHYTGVTGEGLPITWPAAGSVDKLELHCHARPRGWQKWVSWLWPTRQLFLQGTAPVALSDRRFVVVPLPGAPIRLSSRVVATHEVSPEARWDERALPLLEEAARDAKTLSVGATWTIVTAPSQRSLVGQSSTRTPLRSADAANAPGMSSTPDDTATYAILSPESFRDATQSLTECAQIIALRAPQTSIKWLAREKPTGDQPRAVLWLDFKPIVAAKTTRHRRRHHQSDTSIGARSGWVVRAGDVKATPVDWWSALPLSSQNVNATPQPTPEISPRD